MAATKKLSYTQCPMCDSKSIGSHMVVKDHSISKESFELWGCSDCSFLFTQNPPTEIECGPYYESDVYISHSDAKDSLRDKLYHRARDYMLERKWRIILNHTANKAKGSLLDVGAGTGYFLNHIQSKNWDISGIEVSDKARAFSKDRFGIDTHPPQRLFEIDNKFDVITLWHVLEHLYDFHKYIAQFKTLLKDNGLLIIAVPNHNSSDAKKYGADWAAYDVPRHLWHFTPSDFNHITEKHGLSLISKYAMPLDAFYVSMLSEQYRKGAALVGGGIQGLLSNLKAMGNVDRSSSIIYVLGK